MKKLILVMTLAFLFAAPAYAKSNNEACKTILCLGGKMKGTGTTRKCDTAIHNYFSIVKFKVNGGVSLSSTSRARGKFLKKCSNDDGWGKKVNGKFGRKIG